MWNPFKPKNSPPVVPVEESLGQAPELEPGAPLPASVEQTVPADDAQRRAMFDEDLLAVAQADGARAGDAGAPVPETEPSPVKVDTAKVEAAEKASTTKKSKLKAWLPSLGRADKHLKPEIRPIRVLMGYLPEVSARDAREYAQGVAEKHFEQMGLVFFGAFPCDNGFVFEVHEGGEGKAYAPEILKHFESLGPFQVGEQHTVCIQTATRVLEVQRTREGLAAILLPESSPAQGDEWLVPTKPLTPAMDRRDKVFYVGAAIFASGFVAMLLSGTIFRVQLYEEPPAPKPVVISAASLPMSQWSRLQALPDNAYVRALRFKNGRWDAPEIQTESSSPSVAAPAVPVPPGGPAPEWAPTAAPAAPDAPKP